MWPLCKRSWSFSSTRKRIDYKLVFEACLGHYLAILEFTAVLCLFFGVDESKLPPTKGNQETFKSKSIDHHKRVVGGKCELCHMWLAGTRFSVTPCCNKHIHEHYLTYPDECTLCREPFSLLLCCVFKQQIEVFWTSMEGFETQRELRTPCCGADIHYNCRTLDLLSPSNILPVCPVCCVPLTHDGRADHRSPGDVFHARKQMNCNNNQRRRKKMNYISYFDENSFRPWILRTK